MSRLRLPTVSPRKLPSQARSTQLVADILKAAVRVLQREGPQRFTTIRVAEAAGVSVGSLYQYFPNKQAILFRLQVDEWEQTGAMLDALMSDTSQPPKQRLHAVVRAFFRSECEEAPLRQALDALTPSYHDAPEARAGRSRSRRILNRFIAAAAPGATARQRSFAADLVLMTMSSIGKEVSERHPSDAELDRWAEAVADMLTLYLASLGQIAGQTARRTARPRGRSRA